MNPEGDFFESVITEDGKYHSEGSLSFTVAVDPLNKGVRLRRLLDQKIPRQKANVYVNGKFAGSWYLGYENEHLRAYEQDFDIHPDFCKGEKTLKIRLDINGQFTDFNYTVFSFIR